MDRFLLRPSRDRSGVPPQGSGANTGVGINGPAVYGSDSLRFDGMLLYQARGTFFGRNLRASVRLNMKIFLDDHDLELRRFESDGARFGRFVFTDPREITLSTTLRC